MRLEHGAVRQHLDDNENVIEDALMHLGSFNASSLAIEVFACIRAHDCRICLDAQVGRLWTVLDAS